MTTKEQLIKEIATLPDSLLSETLDFVCFLKAKYTTKNSQNLNEEWLHQSPFKEKLDQALEWNANNPPQLSDLEALESQLDSYE